MLRITAEENDGRTRFRLDGKLKGQWVGELERCWIYTRNARPEMEFSIDLNNVDFVDESGSALLTHMASQGARLEARSNLMLSSLIQDSAQSNGSKQIASAHNRDPQRLAFSCKRDNSPSLSPCRPEELD